MTDRDLSTREEISRILLDPNNVPDDIRQFLRRTNVFPAPDIRLGACVILLLRKIEQIEGDLNPEDNSSKKL